MDFVYTLTIDKDGGFELWIDRNKLGKCEIKGKAHVAGGKLLLGAPEDQCHPDVREPDYELVVTQFTGDAFVLTLRDDTHAYRRAATQ